jgi:hypothetical protein
MINTSVENYDINTENQDEPMTQEEILMSEGDILAGLLELANEKDDEANYRKIRIMRNGKVKVEFRVRPISEEECQQCFRNSTKYAKTKPGQPRVAIETNSARNRSYIIYTATVDEDRKKVWDNEKVKQSLGVLDSIEMVDRILKAGEKSRVIAEIDEISGYTDEQEEAAKN